MFKSLFEDEKATISAGSEVKALSPAIGLWWAPDEVRRGSANAIFEFFASNPPTVFLKRPYYKMDELEGRDDPNSHLIANYSKTMEKSKISTFGLIVI